MVRILGVLSQTNIADLLKQRVEGIAIAEAWMSEVHHHDWTFNWKSEDPRAFKEMGERLEKITEAVVRGVGLERILGAKRIAPITSIPCQVMSRMIGAKLDAGHKKASTNGPKSSQGTLEIGEAKRLAGQLARKCYLGSHGFKEDIAPVLDILARYSHGTPRGIDVKKLIPHTRLRFYPAKEGKQLAATLAFAEVTLGKAGLYPERN